MGVAKATLAVVIGVFLASCLPDESDPERVTQGIQARSFLGTQTITVNTGTSTGAVMWGGIGFLYGLSESPNLNGYSLSDSMLTGLVHPQYTSQKAPGGAQHPDGDARNTLTATPSTPRSSSSGSADEASGSTSRTSTSDFRIRISDSPAT